MFAPDRLGEIVDGHTLRFVRTVRQPPERVWRAISDSGELSAWMRYPVRFEARVGARVSFFGENERIVGKVFMCDPPKTLAFSFADVRVPEHLADAERDWAVRWDLEPDGDGCRITLVHRRLGGAHLWGLGEGWQGFVDLLAAYLDGGFDDLCVEFAQMRERRDRTGLRTYRLHAAHSLVSYANEAATDARRNLGPGSAAAAVGAIDRLHLAARQLHRIAVQEGESPDYTLPGVNPVDP